jgi:hypothetical protein
MIGVVMLYRLVLSSGLRRSPAARAKARSIGDPVKSMPKLGTERAVVDCVADRRPVATASAAPRMTRSRRLVPGHNEAQSKQAHGANPDGTNIIATLRMHRD